MKLLLVATALSGANALTAAAAPARAGNVGMMAKDSPKGKGGIFPWVTNEPGTYAELPSLSSGFMRKAVPEGALPGSWFSSGPSRNPSASGKAPVKKAAPKKAAPKRR